MGDASTRQGPIGNLFRVQLKMERLRRNATQAQLAAVLNERYGLGMHASTIGKIEAGDRDVTVDELFAFSGLFGISVDAFLGSRGSGADALWAAEKLTSNAQKMAGDIVGLRERLVGDRDDLEQCAERDKRYEAVADIVGAANTAEFALENARAAVAALASEFPLPGMK